MSIWIQITSGRGPAECCRVVTRVAALFLEEAQQADCDLQVLEQVEGEAPDTHHSMVFTLAGTDVPAWIRPWIGTIQWIGNSTYRPHHKRKNWFIGVQVLEQPEPERWRKEDVKFDTFRASGPGGQNVNKTESAVRATHIPTGIAVVAQEARSQHENKNLAFERLRRHLQCDEEKAKSAFRKQLWQQHNELERGNPVRVYSGEAFDRIK